VSSCTPAGDGNIRRWQAVAAFTIGFLPAVATQVVIRAASAPVSIQVGG